MRRSELQRAPEQPWAVSVEAAQAGPRRLELEAVGRLIDGYGERLIEKAEFESRVAELRKCAASLEAEAGALQARQEQARSFQMVIGKLDLFAGMVRDRLEAADWPTQRDIVCTLVKRIEVADDVVRVVFRVDPGQSDPLGPRRVLAHCPTRRRHAPDAGGRHCVPVRRPGGGGTGVGGVTPPASPGWGRR